MSLSSKPRRLEKGEDAIVIDLPQVKSPWIQLKDPGFGSCTNPVKINGDKFIIGELDGMFTGTDCGIHQYSTTKNEWTKLNAYPEEFTAHKPSMVYNYETNKIWMIGDGNPEILGFDYTKPNNFKIIKYDDPCVGAHPSILLIKGEYHIIFGSDNTEHLIFGSDNTEHLVFKKNNNEVADPNVSFETKHTICDDYEHGLENAKCVYIESKREILTFGGSDYGIFPHRNIHRYSFYDDEWVKMANNAIETFWIWMYIDYG